MKEQTNEIEELKAPIRDKIQLVELAPEIKASLSIEVAEIIEALLNYTVISQRATDILCTLVLASENWVTHLSITDLANYSKVDRTYCYPNLEKLKTLGLIKISKVFKKKLFKFELNEQGLKNILSYQRNLKFSSDILNEITNKKLTK